MPIEFSCSQCHATIRVPDSAAGKKAQCPSCAGITPVPSSAIAPQSSLLASGSTLATTSPFKEDVTVGGNPFGDVGGAVSSHLHTTHRSNGTAFDESQLADRGSRLLAAIVDGFVVAGPLFVFAVGIFVASGGREPSSEAVAFAGLAGVFFMFLLVVYNMYLTSVYGETIGKRVASVRIVNDIDGLPPGFVNGVLLRSWVVVFLGTCVPLFGLIDVLFIFGSKRQCLHDMMASTRVISGRYKDSLRELQ